MQIESNELLKEHILRMNQKNAKYFIYVSMVITYMLIVITLNE